jgi:hypothetical protein
MECTGIALVVTGTDGEDASLTVEWMTALKCELPTRAAACGMIVMAAIDGASSPSDLAGPARERIDAIIKCTSNAKQKSTEEAGHPNYRKHGIERRLEK